MRKTLIRLFGAGVFSLFACNAVSETITVMTYNLMSQEYTDTPTGSPSDGFGIWAPWPARKSLVYQIIDATSPDIISLQEDETQQKNDIASHYSVTHSIVNFSANLAQTWGGKGHHGSILYNKNKFSLISSGQFQISGPRYGHWAKIKSLKTDKEVVVYNMHWYGNNVTGREASAVATANKIWSMHAGEIVILTGDLNTLSDSPVQYLLGNKNHFSHLSYHSNFQPLGGSYNSGALLKRIQGSVTQTFFGTSTSRIDHIFASKETTVSNYVKWSAQDPDPSTNPACTGCLASDHSATVAQIKLSTEPEESVVPAILYPLLLSSM